MALTRARPIAGDAALRQRIAATIEGVLRLPREAERLVADVADMRRRIAHEHPHPSPGDLKNRPGGLIDLEFIAQYLMLRDAAARPQILRRSTADALKALAATGVLPAEALSDLGSAAALLRHLLSLQTLIADNVPAEDGFSEADAASLARCAGAVDFARLDADITRATAAVGRWYQRLIEEPALRARPEIGEPAGDQPE